MASYFISDVHLGLGPREAEKEKEDGLLRFLKWIRPSTESLYIVGDLFDFWFEYKTVIPKGFHRTLSEIQLFSEEGKPVHYLAGNHDFWVDDFFQNELGVVMHLQPFETTVQRKRVFLHHGDGLAEHDVGYRLIKPILRSRINYRLYRWLHPDIGVPLARGSSRTSREYTSNREYGDETGMIRFARKKFREGIDIVVMGHRHQPRVESTDGGTYVNLGDWITFRTYGELRDGTIALKEWKG